MLLDTGSVLTLIDETVWESIRKEGLQLEAGPCEVTSATKHALNVLGQVEITLQLLTRNGSWQDFKHKVVVVKGLAKRVIIGMDFLISNNATIDLQESRVYLYKNRTKTVYELVHGIHVAREVRLIEKTVLGPRTVVRQECEIEGNIVTGELVLFSPNRNLPILVAASVDCVRNNRITVELVNTTLESTALEAGTVIGITEPAEGDGEGIWEQEAIWTCPIGDTSTTTSWSQKIEIGEENTPQKEVQE